jgi:hypothetical protein
MFKYLSDYRELTTGDLSFSQIQDLLQRDGFFHLEDTSDHHPHSEIIDQLIGIRPKEIEHKLLVEGISALPEGNLESWGKHLHQGHQTWVGLDPNILQTPYAEIFEMLQKISPQKGDHIIDLGAAYGRMGVVLKFLYPEVFFTGLEYLEVRVSEGNRIFKKFECHNALLIQQDLSVEDFQLPEAEIYFLYDYGRPDQIRFTLKALEVIGDKKDIIVVARGIACRHYIQKSHPWLSHIFDPYHSNEFSIFSNYRDI